MVEEEAEKVREKHRRIEALTLEKIEIASRLLETSDGLVRDVDVDMRELWELANKGADKEVFLSTFTDPLILVDFMQFPFKIPPKESALCICKSLEPEGTMVFCENPDCKIKWFHLACLGIGEQVSTTTLSLLCIMAL